MKKIYIYEEIKQISIFWVSEMTNSPAPHEMWKKISPYNFKKNVIPGSNIQAVTLQNISQEFKQELYNQYKHQIFM